MKTVLTKFLAISSISLLMLASCKKDETKVVATNGKAGALQASSTTIVLTKADIANTAVTFNWGAADFGYKAAVTNVLQIDVKGDNFASPKEYTISGKTLTQSFSVPDFNALLLALNLPTGTASLVEARIKSQLSASVTPAYSNTVGLTVTPFALISYLYAPGAYQGWHPSTADSLVSVTGNGVYTGIINFTGTDLNFKLNTNKSESWTGTNYGLLAGVVSGASNAGNFTAPTAGLNWVTLDLNANTITYAPVQFYYSVIGDAALGWDKDSDMKYDNGNQLWTITIPLSSTGSFKVRRNHDWGTSYGILKVGPDGVSLDSSNDDNIPVPTTGTYKFTFALKASDNTKATYTLVKQ